MHSVHSASLPASQLSTSIIYTISITTASRLYNQLLIQKLGRQPNLGHVTEVNTPSQKSLCCMLLIYSLLFANFAIALQLKLR